MGSRFRGSQSVTIEEGAMVRERQTILRLPDLAQMQVKVNVHESKVEQIEPDMRARIRILDRELSGTVTSVANQPEPTSFFQASVKEYGTVVRIDGQPEGLRPGMTAEVEILVADLKGVPALPVAAIVEQRGKFFCWVKTPAGVERRRLTLGLSNDEFVEVRDGVGEGEQVVLNPRAVISNARQMEDEADVTQTPDETSQSGTAATPANPEERSRPPLPANRPPEGPPRDSERDVPTAGPEHVPGGAGPDRGPGRGGPEGGGPGGGGPGGRSGGGFDPMQFDADGDGRVTKQEAPERMQRFFDHMDSNGDGAIDEAEIEEMRNRYRGGPGSGRGPGAPGP
jgi:hypothetical protein